MKVTIIGPGTVGVALAYTLVLRQVVREIVLVGKDRERAEGEALDMMHAQAFLRMPVTIRAGELEDAAGSEVVAVCASVPTPRELTDRNDLARGNVALMKRILPEVARVAPDCNILMVSNPVDVLTWQALALTGFPPCRVMGTGTLVDSMRFREMISEKAGIHADDLRAYMLGEHGEHQFPAMSVAQAGGEALDDTPERRAVADHAKRVGIEVFQKKGNTCFAIALSAAYVIESILLDERRTIPLSVRIDGYLGVSEVCLSLPVVVGKGGIARQICPNLNPDERAAFRRAADAVKETIADVLGN